uniref:S100/CaBP-9k-type calcium binding subdomain domain-containing protein n=1 Tax=Oncorhynchus tshawytscha TaxID=74940 RepID=A0AAZ3QZS5_ONCTS
MPSDLERAMESMITVFHKYAAKEGSGNTLSRRELRDLMENELSGFLKVAISTTTTLYYVCVSYGTIGLWSKVVHYFGNRMPFGTYSILSLLLFCCRSTPC